MEKRLAVMFALLVSSPTKSKKQYKKQNKVSKSPLEKSRGLFFWDFLLKDTATATAKLQLRQQQNSVGAHPTAPFEKGQLLRMGLRVGTKSPPAMTTPSEATAKPQL
jgi:hypothetical protein